MKERPILFSDPMIRALLAGTKTQTRRAIKTHRSDDSFVCVDYGDGWWPYRSEDGESDVMSDGCEYPYNCPYGVPGDRLWVRERHALENRYRNVWCRYAADDAYVAVPAPMLVSVAKPGWRPSIHMPRWASRITLEITDVRVERLQDISEEDAKAEGTEPFRLPVHPARESLRHVDGYSQLWDSINGEGSWDLNPWVWALTFRRVHG